jgi:hypothetical protein
MQAVALGSAADSRRGTVWAAKFTSRSADRQEHPLINRYARLLADLLSQTTPDGYDAVYRTVWVIDTEALAAAGGELDDEPAEILAAVTVVLNLVGARIAAAGVPLRGNQFRIPALTEPRLPGCLQRPFVARSSTRLPCSCGMQLCGPDLNTTVRRQISPTFAYRCLSRDRDRRLLPARADRWRDALDIHLARHANIPGAHV